MEPEELPIEQIKKFKLSKIASALETIV